MSADQNGQAPNLGFGAGDPGAGAKTPDISVAGNTSVDDDGNTVATEDCNNCTAVYRSAVAGMRIWVGKEVVDTCDGNKGYIMFAAAGHPHNHPHDHQALMYPYGEFCTQDKNLISCLDDLLQCGKVFGVHRVVDPQPIA